ncbi:MAG: hypothetical protein DRP56_07275 [Planctomycetota bacterium]|nr:MAG: hypothetical protein DRP56_07275 [Planctomycetota bacterium]
MAYPPLVKLNSATEYRQHFENIYCRRPIAAFDGIQVRFRKRDFNHCFFETVSDKDDTFSFKRAERMDWIKAALQDPNSDRFVGWNAKKKQHDQNRRVTLVKDNFVVVIALTGSQKADFITAFVADSERTLQKIRSSPRWV